MSRELQAQAVLAEIAGSWGADVLLAYLTPKSVASGSSSIADLTTMFHNGKKLPDSWSNLPEGTLLLEGVSQFEGWAKCEHRIAEGWNGPTVSLADLRNGQTAWLRRSSELWVFQKVGSLFLWYLLKKE